MSRKLAPGTNPFDVVKATDLSDEQIASHWVELSDSEDSEGLLQLIKPTSPVSMFVLGGKGSGKTHLMRYISSALQARRARSRDVTPLQGLKQDGYLGIYTRCGGINSSRFTGKGQTEDAWAEVFAYYLELWLGQTLLEQMRSTLDEEAWNRNVSEALKRLADSSDLSPPSTLEDLSRQLSDLQKRADYAINNCAITRSLDLQIHHSAGSIIFGLPQIMAEAHEALRAVRFVYLLDELENLTREQQKHINSLIRDQESPVSFKVGSRLYGVRTYEIRGSQEVNREGSEFEILRLDDIFRKDKRTYETFARRLVKLRLEQAGLAAPTENLKALDNFFDAPEHDRLLTNEMTLVKERYLSRERPYVLRLRASLEEGLRRHTAPGLESRRDIDRVLSCVTSDEYPFVERATIMQLFRLWAQGQELIGASEGIERAAREYISGRNKGNPLAKMLKYFKADVVANLLRETGQRQGYLGLPAFITMSAGLPRNLLTLLKHIYTWASFAGEHPFTDRPISRRSQSRGVLEATEWFFNDARAPGVEGHRIRRSMERVGDLLRALRFSDKPAECSLCTFSVKPSMLSDEARETLYGCVSWSMLIRHSRGHRQKNDSKTSEKFQVSPMLAPRWDLPIASRGAIELTKEEALALFEHERDEDYRRLVKARVDRMTAPDFKIQKQEHQVQMVLPGSDD